MRPSLILWSSLHAMPLRDRIQSLLRAFPHHPVAGIGDVMLDQYRRGKATGLSPEAPAVDLLNPSLHETPGGAANVAWNVGYLGGRVRLVAVVGADREGERVRTLLEATPGVTVRFVEDPSRPTTLKLRYYHDQFQILRVSQESKTPLPAAVSGALRETLAAATADVRGVFVEDYGKQTVNADTVEALIALRARRPDLPVVLDPKIGNHHVYQSGMCSHLKPNWQEACALANVEPETADREHVARWISERYACDALITLGGSGVLVYERTTGRALHVPTRPREAFDVAGAGDTTLAAITCALAAGGSALDAAVLANLAGGIVVEKSGTAYATPVELAEELAHPKTAEILAPLAEAVAARPS